MIINIFYGPCRGNAVQGREDVALINFLSRFIATNDINQDFYCPIYAGTENQW